jgi:hypothetical protein
MSHAFRCVDAVLPRFWLVSLSLEEESDHETN